MNAIPRWAAPPLGTSVDDFLASVRSQFPVSLIATPRKDLRCRPKEITQGIEEDQELTGFDQIPLTDGSGDRIVAMYVRDEGVVELREDLFMAADASLLSFLESADRQRFRLLISGGGVYGMVTLSDVQKLPVYAVLFSLVVAVEMLLMDWIRQVSRGDDEVWLQHLKAQQKKIERHWNERQDDKMDIDRLSVASFGDEIIAAEGLGLFRNHADQKERIERLADLRNLVCHAIEFAPTSEHALKIPEHVRNACALIEWLSEQLDKRTT